jgi:hypothetical protein
MVNQKQQSVCMKHERNFLKIKITMRMKKKNYLLFSTKPPLHSLASSVLLMEARKAFANMINIMNGMKRSDTREIHCERGKSRRMKQNRTKSFHFPQYKAIQSCATKNNSRALKI